MSRLEEHYGRPGLGPVILGALRAAGKNRLAALIRRRSAPSVVRSASSRRDPSLARDSLALLGAAAARKGVNDGEEAPRRKAEEVRRRLERERDAAIERFRSLGISADLDEAMPRVASGTPLDEGDEAQASERQDVAFATRQRLAARINRLNTALERIERGTYGVCRVCGEPIESERLAALPEADTCLKCQETLDREAGVHAA